MFLNTKMKIRRLLPWCVFFVILYLYLRYHHEPTPYELVNNDVVDNLSCHYIREGDALLEASTINPSQNSIFFHDTSCRGTLNSRQLCAIESAARKHLDREIYLFFSGPVSEAKLNTNLKTVSELDNVNLVRVHVIDYAAGTPVQMLMVNGVLNSTKWGIENMSNVLRFLTLFKWGGVYLDTDVIVQKSLDGLPANWIAREDKYMVNAAAISLSHDNVGRRYATAFLEEIVTSYRPDIWSHNGPGTVTRVLMRECGTNDVTAMSRETCQGIAVLPPALIYPIHYSKRKLYFKPGYNKDTSQVYIHHFWNRITRQLDIPKDSLYDKLAKEFCPAVYKLYGDKFGS